MLHPVSSVSDFKSHNPKVLVNALDTSDIIDPDAAPDDGQDTLATPALNAPLADPSPGSFLSSPAFARLSRTFTGPILTPSHPAFLSALQRWSTTALRPAPTTQLVLCPRTALDCARAVVFARRTRRFPLAVCCGGHSTSGASSATPEGGIVVDLRRGGMCGVRVDEEQQVAYVQGGALWAEVDEEAAKYGLATVAGTVNHFTNRLTLGGGYGWLTGQYGLVIDNLLQVSIVTASGAILVVSPIVHPDLFWALRGAGIYFGIVTEFVFRLYPQREKVFAGSLLYAFPELAVAPQDQHNPVDANEEESAQDARDRARARLLRLLTTTNAWWNRTRAPVGPCRASALQVLTRLGSTPAIVQMLFYNGSEEEGREAFCELLDPKLGPSPLLPPPCEIPYTAVNALQNLRTPHGRAVYMRGVRTERYDIRAVENVFNVICSGIGLPSWGPQENGGANDIEVEPTMLIEFFPLHMLCSTPHDATAFALRRNEPRAKVTSDGSVAVVVEESEEDLGGGNVLLLCTWDEKPSATSLPNESEAGKEGIDTDKDVSESGSDIPTNPPPSSSVARARAVADALSGVLARAQSDPMRAMNDAYGNYVGDPEDAPTSSAEVIAKVKPSPVFTSVSTPVPTKPNLDARLRAQFGSNYARLQRIKAAYDPLGVFGAVFGAGAGVGAGGAVI